MTGRPEEGNRGIALAVAALVLLGAGAGFAGAQYVLYRQERTELAIKVGFAERELRALEVTEEKNAEFTAEVASVTEQIEQVRQRLPQALDLPAFLLGYVTLAGGERVAVHDIETEEQTEAALHSGTIQLELRGSPAALEALRARTLRMPRMAHWQEVKRSGQGLSVVLTVFASPSPPPPTPRERDCSPEASQVWLWPWKGRLSRMRGEWTRLCAEIARHAETARRIDAFHADRAELQTLTERVQRLQAEQEGETAGGGSP